MNMHKDEPSPEKKERGRRIKKAREDADLTQAELAEALSLRGYPATEAAIGNWEQGTRFPRDPDTIKALADICDTYASIIFGLPEAPVDRRQGKINTIYATTDERGRDAIWRIAESQPADHPQSRNDQKNKKKA